MATLRSPAIGAQEKRWAEYKRAIRQALDEKQPAPGTKQDGDSGILRAVDLIGKAVGSSLNDPEILRRLCEALRSTAAADFTYTIGFDPETATCHTLGGDDTDALRILEVFDARYTRAKFLESLPALALGERVEIDVAASALPLAEIYRDLGFQRVLHLPLTRGRELGGVLLVGRRNSSTAFDETSRAILDAVAPTAELALEIDRMRRKLARSERVSHYLAANISHDLRNTFSVIIGYGEILRDEARRGASLEGTNSAMVERIYSAACEALDIMRPAFELSNPMREHTPIEIDEVSVSDLVDDLVTEHFAHQRLEVGMSVDIDPALPSVRTDRMKLRMLLEQVLSNAQKFTSTGEITVVAKCGQDQRVAIAISDTGPGISRERLAGAFDALGEPPVPVEGESTIGLGLYICKQLTDRLGADLQVETELGEGTTVRITLPLQPPD